VIHRDIKPENLLFGGNFYLKLADFGIARVAKQYNSNDSLGSSGYMSPEVLFI
jgi:serine/threonine protein kinase